MTVTKISKGPYKNIPTRSDLILQALDEYGPMTCIAIADALGVERGLVSNILVRLRKKNKRGKEIYIIRWERHCELNAREYLRPVYARGNKECRRKPPPLTRHEIWERYYKKKDLKINSVFALGARMVDKRVTTGAPVER